MSMYCKILSRWTREELVAAKIRLEVAWEMAFAISDYELCEMIEERVGKIREEQSKRPEE